MINNTCPLVINDLYHYDISKCYYNILKSIGWDMSDIPEDNKEERNKKIGILQKKHPQLSSYLINSTNNIIDHYLIKNNVDEKNDLIVRQRDGIIVKKKLNFISSTIPIDFRYSILKIIIDIKRRMFLLIKTDGQVEVKGVSNKPADHTFYEMFKNIDFGNKRSISDSIERMRQSFFRSENIKWFAIPSDNDSFLIPIKDFGLCKLNLSTLSIIDQSDVDKLYVWKNYVWPFCQSIIIN